MSQASEFPVFAVVGHPNQGKSSVVSTLVQDDHIAVSPISGTTREAHQYQLLLGQQTLYELVDTPGFQRARQMLDWCREHSRSAADHPRVLAAFVQQHRQDPRFADECALLEPIINGAGIVYVADADRPVSAAIEAELTLLSWTARPRLALLNPFGEARYLADWTAALQQYFSLVRNFNPLLAPFAQHVGLLRSMAEIHAPWREGLLGSAEALELQRQARHKQAADALAQYLREVLQFRLLLPVMGAKESIRSAGLANYNRELRQREADLQSELARLYGHGKLDWQAEWQPLQTGDLTNSHVWRAWGLPRKRLAQLSAAAGAMSGLVVDAALGGASMLLGAAIGGTLGGLAGGFAGRDPLSFQLVSKVPGYEQWQLGPVSNIEFAVALTGRALRSWYQVRLRNHARRDALLVVSQDLSHWLDGLQNKQQVQLLYWLRKSLKAPLSDDEQHQLQLLLLALGEQMETEAGGKGEEKTASGSTASE